MNRHNGDALIGQTPAKLSVFAVDVAFIEAICQSERGFRKSQIGGDHDGNGVTRRNVIEHWVGARVQWPQWTRCRLSLTGEQRGSNQLEPLRIGDATNVTEDEHVASSRHTTNVALLRDSALTGTWWHVVDPANPRGGGGDVV